MVAEQVQRYLDLSGDEVLEAIDVCADEGGAHGRRWVLDPIDGTKGFLRKQQYAVALGLLIDGEPALGVLGCPNLPSTASTHPHRLHLFGGTRATCPAARHARPSSETDFSKRHHGRAPGRLLRVS